VTEATVSVVITCYNQRDYVAEAIRSVLRQSRCDRVKEIIVVDDGSTDGSDRVIAQLAKENNKIVHLAQRNSGVAMARNAAIRVATGEYVALLDGDDVWLPQKLEIQLPSLDRSPALGLVYSDYVALRGPDGADRSPVKARAIFQDDPYALQTLFVHGAAILPSTTIVRRSVYDTCGGFDPELRNNEEVDMWLRIAANSTIHYVPGTVVEWRDLEGGLHADVEAYLRGQRYVSNKLTAMHPDLLPFVKLREVRVHRRAGRKFLSQGNRPMARAQFKQGILRWKPDRKAILYLGLSLVPGDALKPVGAWKRLLGHRWLVPRE
jgi:glycosyltransferase involved in cell wall biosynthesis